MPSETCDLKKTERDDSPSAAAIAGQQLRNEQMRRNLAQGKWLELSVIMLRLMRWRMIRIGVRSD